jgi:hypothetical protein
MKTIQKLALLLAILVSSCAPAPKAESTLNGDIWSRKLPRPLPRGAYYSTATN